MPAWQVQNFMTSTLLWCRIGLRPAEQSCNPSQHGCEGVQMHMAGQRQLRFTLWPAATASSSARSLKATEAMGRRKLWELMHSPVSTFHSRTCSLHHLT
jgi:hypothetical protein